MKLPEKVRVGETLSARWLNQVVDCLKELAKAANMVGNGTLRNIVATCRAFPPEAHHERLSLSHHQETACIQSTAEERESFLTLAEREGYSCTELRNHLRQVVQEKEQKCLEVR